MNTTHEEYQPSHRAEYSKEVELATASNDKYEAQHASDLDEENVHPITEDVGLDIFSAEADKGLTHKAEVQPGKHKLERSRTQKIRRLGATVLNSLRERLQPIMAEETDTTPRFTQGAVPKRVATARQSRRGQVSANVGEKTAAQDRNTNSETLQLKKGEEIAHQIYKNGVVHWWKVDENGNRLSKLRKADVEKYQGEIDAKEAKKAKTKNTRIDKELKSGKSFSELSPAAKQRWHDNIRNTSEQTSEEAEEEKEEERNSRRRAAVAAVAGILATAAVVALGLELIDNDDDKKTDRPGQEQTEQPTVDGNNIGKDNNGGNGQNQNEEPRAEIVNRYNFADEGVRLRMIDTDGDGDADRAVATLTPGGNIWNASERVLDVTDGPNRQPTVRQTDRLKDDVLRETKWNERSAHNMPVGTTLEFKVNGKKVTAK